MPRATPEWIGKTPQSKVPPRVQLRVFEAYGGRCHISGIKIRPGDKFEMDHIVALINGGENRETNLAPALVKYHRQKTSQDVAEKAKTAKVKMKHLGITRPKQKIKSKGFGGYVSNAKDINSDMEKSKR